MFNEAMIASLAILTPPPFSGGGLGWGWSRRFSTSS